MAGQGPDLWLKRALRIRVGCRRLRTGVEVVRHTMGAYTFNPPFRCFCQLFPHDENKARSIKLFNRCSSKMVTFASPAVSAFLLAGIASQCADAFSPSNGKGYVSSLKMVIPAGRGIWIPARIFFRIPAKTSTVHENCYDFTSTWNLSCSLNRINEI
eukprot:scaffold2557_cov121-Cylindrotheca_fusiformis.AAC.36